MLVHEFMDTHAESFLVIDHPWPTRESRNRNQLSQETFGPILSIFRVKGTGEAADQEAGKD